MLVTTCPNCEIPTQFRDAYIGTQFIEPSGEWAIDAAFACVRCSRVISTHFEYYSSFYDSDLDPERDPVTVVEKFSDDGRIRWRPVISTVPAFSTAPEHPRSIAQEAFRCFDSGCYRASVVMARSAIEAIAKDHGVPAECNNIYKKIEELGKMQLLTKKALAILHELRQNGNDVAHADPSADLTRNDAQDLLTLLELVFDTIYEEDNLLAKVKKRREERKSQAAGAA